MIPHFDHYATAVWSAYGLVLGALWIAGLIITVQFYRVLRLKDNPHDDV